MRNIMTFEELKYSTYLSFADELEKKGQRGRSEGVKKFARERELGKIKEIPFDILVGGRRIISGAKYVRFDYLKQRDGDSISFIFKSDVNTHIVKCHINHSGVISWEANNKLANRKSSNSLEIVVSTLMGFCEDFRGIFAGMGIDPSVIKLDKRTFYP